MLTLSIGGQKLDLPVNPSFFLQTPHFFFCFLAGGCEDSSSSGVFDSVVTLSDGFESISGVSAVGLEGGWGWVVGFDRIGFIRPAIASVTEPEVLSGVDSRAEFHCQKKFVRKMKNVRSFDKKVSFFEGTNDRFLHLASSFFSSDFSFLATSFLKQTYKKSLNINHFKIRSGRPYNRDNMEIHWKLVWN